jgi:hypothetical protein
VLGHGDVFTVVRLLFTGHRASNPNVWRQASLHWWTFILFNRNDVDGANEKPSGCYSVQLDGWGYVLNIVYNAIFIDCTLSFPGSGE